MNTDIIRHSPETVATTINPAPAFPPMPVAKNGLVRLGGQGPRAAADNGQVRIGGQAPLFQPTIIADAGLVRLGGQSPTF